MYDDVIMLKKVQARTFDSAGNEILTYTERTIPALPEGVYSAEFYNAAIAGMHPSITFRIWNRVDYEGEKVVEYNGTEYAVTRVDWTGKSDDIRLICEERTNVQ